MTTIESGAIVPTSDVTPCRAGRDVEVVLRDAGEARDARDVPHQQRVLHRGDRGQTLIAERAHDRLEAAARVDAERVAIVERRP
jgi:hypothetical protein